MSTTTFDEELGPSAKEGWCLVEGRRRWVVAKPRFLAVYDASDAAHDAARFVELECSSHKVTVEGCDVSVGNLKLRTEGRDRDRVAREWADALESTIGKTSYIRLHSPKVEEPRGVLRKWCGVFRSC